jgi:hypothetical protein
MKRKHKGLPKGASLRFQIDSIEVNLIPKITFIQVIYYICTYIFQGTVPGFNFFNGQDVWYSAR